MKSNKFINLFFATGLLLASTPAFAMFDIRAGFGVNQGNPSDWNDTFSFGGVSGLKTLPGLTADAMFHLPLVGLGVGVRFEDLNASIGGPVTGGQFDYKLSIMRTSAVVDYRFIDTLIYLGGIGTYGLSHTTRFTYSCPGATCTGSTPTNFDGNAGSTSSWSVGVEGGIKLILVTVGAEAGYSSIVAKNFSQNNTTPQDPSGNAVKLDFSGPYFKVLAGLTF